MNKPLRQIASLLCLSASGVFCAGQNLYVAQEQGASVNWFTTSGGTLGHVYWYGWNPVGLAFDPAGNWYVSDPNAGGIWRFSPSGVLLGSVTGSARGADGLACDANGNLYAGAFSQILKFSTTGEENVFANLPNASFTGLAFDTNGCLYGTSYFAGTVEKFSPTGTYLGRFATNGLSFPNALALDGSGNLYVVNGGTHSVWKFSPAGAGSAFASAELTSPTGLALDQQGNVYVADTGTGSVEKYSGAGNYLGRIISGLSGNLFLAMQIPAPVARWGFQSVARSGDSVSMTWGAISGRVYQIQYKTNLQQPDWQNLGDTIPATNATMAYSEAPGSDPQRFYRVALLP